MDLTDKILTPFVGQEESETPEEPKEEGEEKEEKEGGETTE